MTDAEQHSSGTNLFLSGLGEAPYRSPSFQDWADCADGNLPLMRHQSDLYVSKYSYLSTAQYQDFIAEILATMWIAADEQ